MARQSGLQFTLGCSALGYAPQGLPFCSALTPRAQGTPLWGCQCFWGCSEPQALRKRFLCAIHTCIHLQTHTFMQTYINLLTCVCVYAHDITLSHHSCPALESFFDTLIAEFLGDELCNKFLSQFRPFLGSFFRISRIISQFVHSSILLAKIGISSHQTESFLCCVLHHSPAKLEPLSCTVILQHQLYPATFRFLWFAWLVQGPQVCVQSSFIHTLLCRS